jgi:hypothetical protein
VEKTAEGKGKTTTATTAHEERNVEKMLKRKRNKISRRGIKRNRIKRLRRSGCQSSLPTDEDVGSVD